jgi:hypothetical protein
MIAESNARGLNLTTGDPENFGFKSMLEVADGTVTAGSLLRVGGAFCEHSSWPMSFPSHSPAGMDALTFELEHVVMLALSFCRPGPS